MCSYRLHMMYIIVNNVGAKLEVYCKLLGLWLSNYSCHWRHLSADEGKREARLKAHCK